MIPHGTTAIFAIICIHLALIIVIVCIPLALIFWFRPTNGTKSATDQGLPMPLSRHYDFLGLGTLATLMNAARTGKVHELEEWTYATAGVQTVGIKRLGKLTITTIDPQNIDSILSGSFSSYSMGHRGEYMGPLLGHHSILTVDGLEWKLRRATTRAILGRDRLSDLSSLEEQSTKLLASIEQAGPCQEVDIQDLLAVLAMKVTTDYLGISDDDDKGNQQLSDALDLAQRVVVGRILAGKLMYRLVDSFAFRRACAVCQDKVGKHVERAFRWKESGSASDAKSPTLESGAQETKVKAKVSEELALQETDAVALRDGLIASLVAARDNTAAALGWTYYHLARNPEVYSRLRNEILLHFGDGDSKKELTLDNLKQCAYLRYCIKETLRLEPSVPRSIRHTVEDTLLPRGGGVDGSQPLLVKKGTEIIYSFRMMHRNPLHWGADADQYRPERWETAKPGLAYAPFNAGPRRCLGETFANTVMAYTIVRIVQKYERIEPGPSQDESKGLAISAGFVGFNMDGVKVRLFPAKQ